MDLKYLQNEAYDSVHYSVCILTERNSGRVSVCEDSYSVHVRLCINVLPSIIHDFYVSVI